MGEVRGGCAGRIHRWRGAAPVREVRNGAPARITSPESVLDGRWHHAALTVDVPGKVRKLYLDGNLVGAPMDATSVVVDPCITIGAGTVNNPAWPAKPADVPGYFRAPSTKSRSTTRCWAPTRSADTTRAAPPPTRRADHHDHGHRPEQPPGEAPLRLVSRPRAECHRRRGRDPHLRLRQRRLPARGHRCQRQRQLGDQWSRRARQRDFARHLPDLDPVLTGCQAFSAVGRRRGCDESPTRLGGVHVRRPGSGSRARMVR